MKRARGAAWAHGAGLALAALLLLSARAHVGSGPEPSAGRAPASAADKVIRRWREGPRETARLMIAEYGPPDQASRRALRWTRNGPWAKIIVHASAWPEIFGPRKKDWLEQTVDYRVPPAAVDDLQRFDERLEINRRAGQLSSRSPDEATNILLLNLANEIAAGRRDVRSAREFASRTEALAKGGKSSIYMKRLLFPAGANGRYTPALVPGRRRG